MSDYDNLPCESQQVKEELKHSQLEDCICSTYRRGSVPQQLPERIII